MGSAAPLALDVLVTLVLSLVALNKYGRLRERPLVTLTVLLTWFFSFAIVLVLPLDVSWVRLCRPSLRKKEGIRG